MSHSIGIHTDQRSLSMNSLILERKHSCVIAIHTDQRSLSMNSSILDRKHSYTEEMPLFDPQKWPKMTKKWAKTAGGQFLGKKPYPWKNRTLKNRKSIKNHFSNVNPPIDVFWGVFRGSPFWTLFSTPKTRVNPYSKDPPKRTKKRGETLFFGCFGGGLLIFAAWFFQNLRIRPLKSENRTIGKLSVGIYPPDEKKPVFFNTFFPYQSLPKFSIFSSGFSLF